MSWEIQARHTDYAKKSHKKESDILGNILFDDWTPISHSYEDLTIAVYAFNQRQMGAMGKTNHKLYIYRIYDPVTDEAIPCDIL